jgi:hypothetical protein
MNARLLGIAVMIVGAFGMSGAIANYHFLVGVDDTALFVGGSIVFASGVIALANGLKG